MNAIAIGLALGGMFLGAGRTSDELEFGGGSTQTYEITIQNLTQGAVLTPPIVSLSQHPISIFSVGEPASHELALLAEGGATDDLRTMLEDNGVQDVIQSATPIMPGQSLTVTLKGNAFSRVNLGSMILPSNDAFIAVNGRRAYSPSGRRTLFLKSFDSGTETNDELCESIPGPLCGGEGFSEDAGEGLIAPHAGIQGEGDLSGLVYDWGEPVAKVTVLAVDGE